MSLLNMVVSLFPCMSQSPSQQDAQHQPEAVWDLKDSRDSQSAVLNRVILQVGTYNLFQLAFQSFQLWSTNIDDVVWLNIVK